MKSIAAIASTPDENTPSPGAALAAIGPAKPWAAASMDTTPPSRCMLGTITCRATDAINDPLEYVLHFQRDGPWILMQDKLKEATYTWSMRVAPDGRQDSVASDAAANPRGARGKAGLAISDPLTVDNTPPVVGDMKAAIQVAIKADRAQDHRPLEHRGQGGICDRFQR